MGSMSAGHSIGLLPHMGQFNSFAMFV